MRGIGGIFFENMSTDREAHLKFCVDLGRTFCDLYRPCLRKQNEPYTTAQRNYQLHRRSRYVEFNLMYDRGTLFGIQSKGRTESILMSMPKTACWKYCWKPAAGSVEERTHQYFLQPHDWANMEVPAPVCVGGGDEEPLMLRALRGDSVSRIPVW